MPCVLVGSDSCSEAHVPGVPVASGEEEGIVLPAVEPVAPVLLVVAAQRAGV